MAVQNLSINDCWVYQPEIHKDSRGNFFEWFQSSTFFENTGTDFILAQANCSISKLGVVRGIHFTSRAPGQSKLVTVLKGRVFDVLVDLRRNSPTFGKWDSVILDSNSPQTIYIPWGVGHAFMALEDDTVFTYLCDQRYNPENEFDLNVLDPEISIDWPQGIELIQSEKDKRAPFLNSIIELLPN